MTDTTLAIDVARWHAPTDGADATVLARCAPPVLDVGCGPGRFVRALGERGVAALGVDIADVSVALTRDQGGSALRRNVFEPLPGEGRWPTVLVMDGNIGIGADPGRLLCRIAGLLHGAGQALVEVDPDDHCDERLDVRFLHAGRPLGPTCRWARVGLAGLERYAGTSGCAVSEVWAEAGRSFAAVRRASRATRTA